VVTVRTGRFNIQNSKFCPHSVFMCSVWFSEQTAIISLYSINWVVFTTRRRVFTARYGLGLYIIIQVEHLNDQGRSNSDEWRKDLNDVLTHNALNIFKWHCRRQEDVKWDFLIAMCDSKSYKNFPTGGSRTAAIPRPYKQPLPYISSEMWGPVNGPVAPDDYDTSKRLKQFT
jgi:hypothetical protein